jgi:hypothetical protein
MSAEFVKQNIRNNLRHVLTPHVGYGLWSIYDTARVACEKNKQEDQTIRIFQNLLANIPKWTDKTIRTEVDRITQASKCDYIDDLLLGVFISYIRAFASLQQVDTSHVEIPFTRPSTEKFIHALYIASARKAWTAAYLFKTKGVSTEQQARNRKEIEEMISSCLNDVIDDFIPWKEISKAYFAQPAPPKQPVAVVAQPAPIQVAPPQERKSVVVEPVPEVQEYEEEEEEEEDENESVYSNDVNLPGLTLGEDTQLELDTEEPEPKPEPEPKKEAGVEEVVLEAMETIEMPF